MGGSAGEPVGQRINAMLEEREESLEIDSQTDEESGKEIPLAEMLLVEDNHGLVEDVDITDGAGVLALPLVVEDGLGHIEILPPSLQQPVGEVDVLTVHEERLIKQSHLIECLAAKHHISPTKYLYLGRFLPVEETHVVAVYDAVTGKETVKTRYLAE